MTLVSPVQESTLVFVTASVVSIHHPTALTMQWMSPTQPKVLEEGSPKILAPSQEISLHWEAQRVRALHNIKVHTFLWKLIVLCRDRAALCERIDCCTSPAGQWGVGPWVAPQEDHQRPLWLQQGALCILTPGQQIRLYWRALRYRALHNIIVQYTLFCGS